VPIVEETPIYKTSVFTMRCNQWPCGTKLPISWPFPWSLLVFWESLLLTGYDQASLIPSYPGTLLYRITKQYTHRTLMMKLNTFCCSLYSNKLHKTLF